MNDRPFAWPHILLASASPRRQALLRQLWVPFQQLAVDIPERIGSGEQPLDYAIRLALAKARAA